MTKEAPKTFFASPKKKKKKKHTTSGMSTQIVASAT